jgi:hypothetical protein
MEIAKTKKKSFLNAIYQLHPRRIFLLDALGALLTACILGLILPQFKDEFLLNIEVFYLLAAYVVILFFYSFSIVLIQPVNWVLLMRIIAMANAAYCFFTFGIIFFVSPTISTLGIAYFVGEAGVILRIAYLEWGFANRNKTKQFSKQ